MSKLALLIPAVMLAIAMIRYPEKFVHPEMLSVKLDVEALRERVIVGGYSLLLGTGVIAVLILDDLSRGAGPIQGQ